MAPYSSADASPTTGSHPWRPAPSFASANGCNSTSRTPSSLAESQVPRWPTPSTATTWTTTSAADSVDLLPINSHVRRYLLRAGLRWDYYHYDDHTLIRPGLDLGDLPNAHYFSLRAEAIHNSENHWYFPSTGSLIHARYAYVTDNFFTYNDGPGLHDISARWRVNLPIASRLTMQPMAYGRLFIGDEHPHPFATVLGSEWFAMATEAQMPFDGVTDIEYVDRNLVALRLQLQYRLMKNHYIHARFTMASSFSHFDDFQNPEDLVNLFGGAVAYFYDSFFGPIGFNIGYSNLLDKPTFYLTLGHQF